MCQQKRKLISSIRYLEIYLPARYRLLSYGASTRRMINQWLARLDKTQRIGYSIYLIQHSYRYSTTDIATYGD